MTAADGPQPPRLARWLLRRALEGAARSAIVGDLDEEFVRFIVPTVGTARARRWYWRQAVLSIAACARGAAERYNDPDRPTLAHTRSIMQDMHGLGTDLRAAMRFSVRRPLTSAAVILTLTMGVAANTAVFAVLNATFFKKLPIAHADRLIGIGSKPGGSFSYPEYLASRDVAGLSALIAGGRTTATLGEGQTRRRVVIDLVTANYFTALGIGAGGRGRFFTGQDEQIGQPAVAVMSHEFWHRQFGADPTIVGRTFALNRARFTVVGVAPRGFFGPRIGFGPDLWIPLTRGPLIDDNPEMLSEQAAWLGLMGILDRSSSIEVVRAALTARWKALASREEAVVERLPRGYGRSTPATRTRLRLVSFFVVLILVIGCLNVSTLLGAAVHARQKELAIRASLGAGRVRLLRQLLAEHVLLAAAAGVLGGSAGVWIAYRLASMMAGPFSPGDLDVSADGNVVLFTAGIAIFIGFAVGLWPALRWSNVSVMTTLQGAGAGAGLTRLLRASGLWWLIPGQVALGTVLLASAGVLVKTVYQLKLEIDASSPGRVWFAELQPDTLAPAALADFETALRAHLRTLPGAEQPALATGRLLATSSRGPVFVQGLTKPPAMQPNIPDGLDVPPPPPPPPGRGGPKPKKDFWIVSNNYVTPDYFRALSLPILKGRDFTSADTQDGQRVAIVNETFAKRGFGTGEAIGRRIAWGADDAFDIEIVGIVKDMRSEHLRQAATDAIFFPLAQTPRPYLESPSVTGARRPISLTMVVRASQGQRLHRDQLAQHVLAFDAGLFVDRIWTFEQEAGRALSQERLLAWAGSTLGAIALALLVIGLYGTLAAAVVRSRRELGIRLALGASPGAVGSMVVVRSVAVALSGLALGLPLSYVFIKSFAHLLYGVQPIEPIVIAAIVAIILATAIAAAYFPARRAARVDPVVALRAD